MTLRLPRADASGFDIALIGNSNDIELAAGGFHSHVDNPADPTELVRGALGFVRDLLTPSMRLREWCSNGVPYRWVLESSRGGAWVAEESTGLLFWNYFGRRTERVFQNNQLPSRDRLDVEK